MDEKTIIATFVKARDTKNTIRFEEESDAPAIGVLYVQKLALKASFGTIPDKLTVLVTVTN